MKIKCQCGAELEIAVNKRDKTDGRELIIEVNPHFCEINKPLEFPPLVTINGRELEVDQVIPFPLGNANHYYHYRDPDAVRPVLVEVVDHE